MEGRFFVAPLQRVFMVAALARAAADTGASKGGTNAAGPAS